MAKAELKTQATEANVAAFLDAVPDPRRREEGHALDALHRKVTGCEPRMWGPTIVGYGEYSYTYASGRSGTMARAAFSPRKAALTVYLSETYGEIGADERAEALFARLGPHSRGKVCLYIRRLDKVDLAVLEELVGLSWDEVGARWAE